MKRVSLKLITFFVLFAFIFNLCGQVALAAKQSYEHLKQQREFLKSTISQITVGQEKMALLYDLEGLKLYRSAYEKLKSVSDTVYQDYSNVISQEWDKEITLTLSEDGIQFNPNSKIPTLGELLTNFEKEITNQYVFTCWNISDKLFEIKRDLSSHAFGLIYSGRCDDETLSLLSSAIKNFFIADKILCETTIDELNNIITNTSDREIQIKASVMLKVSEKMYDNANKHINKGQVISSAILYQITYKKLLDTLKFCGFEYSKTMLEDTKDSDGDEISDTLELVFGTNPFKVDTDGDGLSDSIEFKMSKYCSPTEYDTDNDGISDSEEDSDNDGLKNNEEIELGTDPIKEDSDKDGLTDGFEVNTFNTNPLKYDTDNDGLSDRDEYKLGTNPLSADSDNNGVSDGEEKFKQSITENFDTDIPDEKNIVESITIDFEATGDAQSTTKVENVLNKSISTNVVGRVSHPFDITTDSTFDEAVVTFNYDDTMLGDVSSEDLGVLWFDEENKVYVLMDSTVDVANSEVAFTTTHFSEYLLIDKKAWFDSWRTELNYGRNNGNTGETQYYDIVLAIDSSGSMGWNDPNDLRLVAAKQFVDAFLPGDQGAVVDFDGSAFIKVHLTKNKDEIKAAIDTIDSSGGTNIDVAVNTGIDELLSSNAIEDNAKIIILLTDGEGTYYSSTTQRAKDNNIKVFTIGLGYGVDEILLSTIATETNGKYYQITSSSDLLDAFKRVQDDTIGEINTTDTDGDGLYDVIETTGFKINTGEIIKTDPNNPDTDGDGLSDGEEAGEFIQAVSSNTDNIFSLSSYGYGYGQASIYPNYDYYHINSYPNIKDSDYDGYEDDEDIQPLKYNTPEEQEFIADDMTIDEEIFWSFAWGVVASAVTNGIDSINSICLIINSLFGVDFAWQAYLSLDQRKEDVLKDIESLVTSEKAFYFGKLITDYILIYVGIHGTIKGCYMFIVGGIGNLVSIGAEIFSGGTLTPAVAVTTAASIAVMAVGATVATVSFSMALNATGNSVKDGKSLVNAILKKSNSQILRDNMKARAKIDLKYQKEPSYPNAAHHIVPATAKRAKKAQDILKKFDIDINSADNGVYLPTEKGLPGAGNASVHKGRHLNKYIDEVTDRLEKATSRDDCIEILNTIREDLLNGTLKLSKKWG